MQRRMESWNRTIPAAALSLALSVTAPTFAEDAAANNAAMQFFETKVRPVLVEHCYKCHGPERHKGELRVDSLEALLAGGDSGPAIVAGQPEHSVLITAIAYKDEFLQMPPRQKLSDAQIADLTQWVKMGAPWPGASNAAPKGPNKHEFAITDEDRNYWAFRPIVRPATPKVDDSVRGVHPIDSFLIARLAEKGLAPNPLADKRHLIRRLYFDLIGLPPTIEEIDRFEKNEAADAYSKLIDELLARPQYGERWARHWLDVVRYAQTNGYERDSEKPYAWRYRDYVIQSFNEDKPYDRFVIEQLAGDELENRSVDSVIATGFYHLGNWDDEPDDPRMAEFDALDDVLQTTSAAFLGVTLGCARCHDHMFDPFPQNDYYKMLAFFRNIRPYQRPVFTMESANFVPISNQEAIEKVVAEQAAKLAPMEQQKASAKDKKEKKKLEEAMTRMTAEMARKLDWALAVRERGSQPMKTNVLIRGNAATPGAEVEPTFLAVLGSEKPVVPTPAKDAPSTGLRTALAHWIANPKNPLTARVIANRVWQHHFGVGIVSTTNDFGKAGVPPTHPELLDWLAAELIENGWSLKKLHKTILLSDAYQMSAAAENSKAVAIDPGNTLLWRQNLRRLEAEALRDSVLTVSGRLNLATKGRGFFPHLGGEVLAGASKPGAGWDISTEEERSRRSIYTFVKRSLLPPILESFDYNNTVQPVGERITTTVAPQALMLLNDTFLQDQAVAFAGRVEKAGNDRSSQVAAAYRLALGREPTVQETKIALAFIADQEKGYSAVQNRLTFAADVPFSLSRGYLDSLRVQDFFIGPTEGWSRYRGKWEGGYEGLLTVDRRRGPFVLWQGRTAADGVLEGRLTLQGATELGGVIFRATAEGDLHRGYDVVFDPRVGKAKLHRHGADAVLLAEGPFDAAPGQSFPIKVEFSGPRLRVWTTGKEPILDIVDPQPLTDAGLVGVRAWGGGVSLDDLTLTTKSETVRLTDPIGKELPGWRSFGGVWSLRPDGGYEVQPAPGGKSVWSGEPFADGVLEGEVMLLGAKGDAGLLARVSQPTSGVDSLFAYNINFKTDLIRLGKHENNWRELTHRKIDFKENVWHTVRVEIAGARVKIFVDGAAEPVIDYVDANPLPAGQIGLRTFNCHCSFRGLATTVGGKRLLADFSPSAAPKDRPVRDIETLVQRQALQAFCLVLFNLNEFAYVD